jgi:trk system potassium uptake protein TrkH
LDFLTCFSAAASAISNVGPGLGEIIGPDGNYSSLSSYSKIVLMFTMFMGRLEILTILVLFIPSFWKN